MYARSYYGEDVSIPENYDGTAFSEQPSESEARTPRIEPVKSEMKFSPKEPEPHEKNECHEECEAKPSGLFGMDFQGILGGFFSGKRISRYFPKDFGTEEILIIGIALFLIFSPSRDIECALLLLALVFIK